jgi:RNA polymerase sigma-70 factor (ECF subfamily)
MAFHLARQPDLANDLVQETYLRALKAEHTFELRERGIRPWLFKILHNVFFTQMGKQQRAPALIENPGEDLANATLDQGEPAWDLASLDWEQIDERLKHAIDDLPANYRAVLLLWAVEGLKYREIADVLDIPLGTIMSRLHRARATLSLRLADMAREAGIGQASPPL